jgi:glycosyltransferase involved in cell wall biosynthesis
MRFWLLNHFEPIPTEHDARLMRCGMLANRLVERGHEVVWWTSDFDHYRKRHRNGRDRSIQVKPGFEIRLMRSLGYRSHVGPRRLVNNHLMGLRWRNLVRTEDPPNLLFAGWPIPEFGLEATRFARNHAIPAVLDVRDLWPSMWLDILPKRLQSAGRLLLRRYFKMTRRAMSGASAITGVTDSYVDWGVGFSGRTRTSLDRSFGFQFRPANLDSQDWIEAEQTLNEHGYAPDDRIDVVFAGSFSRSFELKTVIEAGRRLDAEAPGRLRLVLCGSGNRWNQIEFAARDIDSVLVLPRLELRELTCLYKSASLGLAPYRNIENFQRNIPNKINEYLEMSLPVVAGVEGAIADLIDDHGVGIRYQPEDSISMASELTAIAKNPDRLMALRDRTAGYRQEHLASRDDIDDLAHHLEKLAGSRPTS